MSLGGPKPQQPPPPPTPAQRADDSIMFAGTQASSGFPSYISTSPSGLRRKDTGKAKVTG